MKSVPRHVVYWEMEFVRQWYRFWMECPLEELVGTPAGHRDSKRNVQTSCTGYVHIAAMRMMENNGCFYSLLN